MKGRLIQILLPMHVLYEALISQNLVARHVAKLETEVLCPILWMPKWVYRIENKPRKYHQAIVFFSTNLSLKKEYHLD